MSTTPAAAEFKRDATTLTKDLQTARNNALPDALERASQAIVSQLANGF